MSASYYLSFRAQVDPKKCDDLLKKINETGLNNFFFIEDNVETTYIECDICDNIGHGDLEALEPLLKLEISDALLETILITEEFEGDQNTFAIGPDSKTLDSQYAFDQITQIHFPQLTEQYKLLLKAHLRDN